MEKVFLSASMVENIVDSQKGSVNSDLILKLKNNTEYKLTVAIRLLKETGNNNDLSDMILLPKDLEARNYKLYSALTFSDDENILRNKGLFEDEIEADGKKYKIEVGYIGIKLPLKDESNLKLVDIVSVFKQEHQIIEEKIKELNNIVNLSPEKFDNINEKLKNLFDIFTKHTEKENLFLYPKKFKDPKLAKIHEFTTEDIKSAYQRFSDYYNKWSNKINENNFEQFKIDTNRITSDMLKRITVEEEEIFNFCA